MYIHAPSLVHLDEAAAKIKLHRNLCVRARLRRYVPDKESFPVGRLVDFMTFLNRKPGKFDAATTGPWVR